jgi:putative hydrolase of the HAD superfamily
LNKDFVLIIKKNISILKLGRVHLKVIKAALFDLDGTLLNRNESVKMFIDRQYDRLNKQVGMKGIWREIFNGTMSKQIP